MAGTLLVAGNPRRKRRKKRSTRRKYRRNPVPYTAMMAGNPRRTGANIFGTIINDAIPASIGALAAKALYNVTALRGNPLLFARLALGIAAPLAISPLIGRSRAKYFGLGALVMAVLPALSQVVGQLFPATAAMATTPAYPTVMGDVPMSELGDVPRSELGEDNEGSIEILDGEPVDFELLEGHDEPFGYSEPFGNAGHGSDMAARFSGG